MRQVFFCKGRERERGGEERKARGHRTCWVWRKKAMFEERKPCFLWNVFIRKREEMPIGISLSLSLSLYLWRIVNPLFLLPPQIEQAKEHAKVKVSSSWKRLLHSFVCFVFCGSFICWYGVESTYTLTFWMKSFFFFIFAAGLVRYSHKLATVSIFTKSGEDHNKKKSWMPPPLTAKQVLCPPFCLHGSSKICLLKVPFLLPVDWVKKQNYYDSNRSRVLGKCQGESYFRKCCPTKNAGHWIRGLSFRPCRPPSPSRPFHMFRKQPFDGNPQS